MHVNDIQRKIAILLMADPKTADELQNQLNIDYDVLMKELSNMLKMKVIKKNDEFPTKYGLDDHITTEINRRKEISDKDSYRIKLQMILDVQGITEKIVEIQLNKVEEMLKAEKNITIYDLKKSDILQQEDDFFGYVDATFTVKDFRHLIHIIMYYTPSALEILSPKKVNFSMYELQDGLIEIAQRTHKYIQELQKRITKEESNLLQKKLFKK
jgi:hypothetical protein